MVGNTIDTIKELCEDCEHFENDCEELLYELDIDIMDCSYCCEHYEERKI